MGGGGGGGGGLQSLKNIFPSRDSNSVRESQLEIVWGGGGGVSESLR